MQRSLLAQSQRSAAAGTYSRLYTFPQCKPDGANPFASLVRDSAGNLYGTTYNGGVKGVGSVFKVTPNGTETLLHSFSGYPYGPDAEYPELASLILDAKDNLYGTSPSGGEFGYQGQGGAVFKVTGRGGKETVLSTALQGMRTGMSPQGGLVLRQRG